MGLSVLIGPAQAKGRETVRVAVRFAECSSPRPSCASGAG
jgi:hypothetical protein